jgi:hypothetical protein
MKNQQFMAFPAAGERVFANASIRISTPVRVSGADSSRRLEALAGPSLCGTRFVGFSGGDFGSMSLSPSSFDTEVVADCDHPINSSSSSTAKLLSEHFTRFLCVHPKL